MQALAAHSRLMQSDDDRALVDAALELHLNSKNPAYECEYRMRHKEGHWVWILDRGKVVDLDTAEKALRVVGTHMDVTERKQMGNLCITLLS